MNNIKLAGFLPGNKYDKMYDICKRVYDVNGICPTLSTGVSGNTIIKIMVKQEKQRWKQER